MEDVQDGAVSEEETQDTAPEETPEVEEAPESQPTFSSEQQAVIERMVREQAERMAREQAEQFRRQFQSEKDQAIARANKEREEALRKAAYAEEVMKTYKSYTGDLDPEVAIRMQKAELDARQRMYDEMERQKAMEASLQQFDSSFRDNISGFLSTLGIDPQDKRLDWAYDTPDYLQKQARILASVSKIQKENESALKQSLKSELEKMKQELRQELGVDSVDTTTGSMIPGKDFDKLDPVSKIAAGLRENMRKRR
jgi:hypothetical protein